MNKSNLFFRLVLVLFVGLLSGCAGLVESNVSSYHEIKANDKGVYGTYSVHIPDDMRDSLEYKNHVALLKSRLNKVGFIEVQGSASPDYLIFFNYSISKGAERSVTNVTPVMEGSSAFARGFNSVGRTAVSRSEFDYIRTISLSIARLSSLGGLQKVYEGTVVSEGSSPNLGLVMPALLDSLFENFPGESGKVRRSIKALER